MTEGIKKSEFPGSLTVDDTATFDFVTLAGDNLKITKPDLITELGLTGSIVAVGTGTGTPILDKQGTVNRIRNLKNGPGVKASIDGDESARIEHNFLVDAVGLPVMLNKTADQPTFVSLLGGDGIDVTMNGEQVVIASSGIPVSVKTVLINQASDFPTAVGGVITLAADTDYLLTNNITVSDRFVLSNNTQLRGVGTLIITLIYDGTGVMFTCEDCNVRFRDIVLFAGTAANRTFFAVTSTTGAGISVIFISDCVLVGGDLGSVHARIFTITQSAILLTGVGGLTLTGVSAELLVINQCSWDQPNGTTAIDLGDTVFNTVDLTVLFVTLFPGTTFLSGLSDSQNLTATGQGVVADVRFATLGTTTLAGITPDDNQWGFFGNNQIRDTVRDGLVSMQGNAADTIILTQGTPVLVNGTFIVGRNSGFTPNTAGRVTYDLMKDILVPISVSLSIKLIGGGSGDQLSACVAKNGTVITDSSIATLVNSSGLSNITLTWQEVLTKDDYVEVFVQNDDSIANIRVTDMILRVQ